MELKLKHRALSCAIINYEFVIYTNGRVKKSRLTTWSRVLLEKLIALQLVKKFPTFYGT
jgi:hypothetical protein